jgi:HD-GYP domain-containing protein (c-di-GMP phosphodiesterase class II)
MNNSIHQREFAMTHFEAGWHPSSAMGEVSSMARVIDQSCNYMPPGGLLNVMLDQLDILVDTEASALALRPTPCDHTNVAITRGLWEHQSQTVESVPGRLQQHNSHLADVCGHHITCPYPHHIYTDSVPQVVAGFPLVAHDTNMGLLLAGRKQCFRNSELLMLGMFASTLAQSIAPFMVPWYSWSAPQNRAAQDQAVLTYWSCLLAMHDRDTAVHCQRTAELSVCMARAMGLSKQQIEQIRYGALVHDIGKIGVPDKILHKPGKLTDEEWQVIQQHPVYAYELLAPQLHTLAFLDIPYCHHEQWDGNGYPRGLRGKEIPLAARLFAVVDVWDALRSERPYRPAWPIERIRAHMLSLAGIHLDPQMVDFFLTLPCISEQPEQICSSAVVVC